jgi:hypothetical protein
MAGSPNETAIFEHVAARASVAGAAECDRDRADRHKGREARQVELSRCRGRDHARVHRMPGSVLSHARAVSRPPPDAERRAYHRA